MCWIWRRTKQEDIVSTLQPSLWQDCCKRTRQHKQDDPVNYQNRPEDWNVKDGEPAAHETNGDGAGGRVPELELGQAADERSKLVVLLGWEGRGGACVAVFKAFILSEGRVEFRGEEGEEEVQEVDAESVGNYDSEIGQSVHLPS